MTQTEMRSKPANDEELSARWLEPTSEGTRRDEFLRTLKERCNKGASPSDRPKTLDLRGICLTGEDLSGLDLSRYDLSGANLSGTDLTDSVLSWTQLCGAKLCQAKLDGCEFLGSNMSNADLSESFGKRAGFGACDLSGALFIRANLTESTMSDARLCGADLRAAKLRKTSLRNADLTAAHFTRADLKESDLKNSEVRGAVFDLSSLRRARLLGIRNYNRASWVGTDIRQVDYRGAYLVRRFILDENYLYEFKTRSTYHLFLYKLWWVTSDCGRSALRWSLWVLFISFLFAGLYSFVEIDYGSNRTVVSNFYFSIVTLTTLGYGDLYPVSVGAQLLAALEALCGYVGLGGLLSILSNKMARRAD